MCNNYIGKFIKFMLIQSFISYFIFYYSILNDIFIIHEYKKNILNKIKPNTKYSKWKYRGRLFVHILEITF